MEEIVSFSCGFALAYLTVRAIRSFGSTVGLLLFLAVPFQSFAASTYSITSHKPGTENCNGYFYYRNNAAGTFSSWTVKNVVNGDNEYLAGGWGGGYDMTVQVGHWNGVGVDIILTLMVPPSGGHYTGEFNVDASCNGELVFNLHTNYVVAPLCITNNSASAANFWIGMTEVIGGTPVESQFGPHYLQPGEIFCTPTMTNSNPTTLQWVAYQSQDGFAQPLPVGGEANGVPQEDEDEASTPVPTAEPSGSVDPFADIPERTDIPTNAPAADRQNAEGIVRAIGESSDRQSATLSNLFTGFGFQNLASLTNLSSTPTNDYGALLEEITNNTHQANLTLSNQHKMATNVAGVGAAFDSIKDAFEASLSNAIVAGSNSAALIWNESQLAGVYSDLTNGMSDTWIYEETAPPASTFAVDLGRGFSWDLNPFASQTTVTSFDGLRSRLGYVCAYIRSWMSWAIGFALFWMCWKKSYYLTLRLHSVEAHINGPSVSWDEIAAIGASLFTGGTAAAIWIGIKKFALVMFITFLTVVIGTLPSLLLVFLSDLGYVPLSGDGFFEQLKTDGLGETLLSTAALWFFWILGHAIPWVVLSTAFVNYMLYDFYSIVLFNLVCTVLRATRILANRPR